jgi:hypothetical protein
MPPPPSGGFDLVHVDGGGALWAITRSAGSPPIVATRWDGVSWTNVDVGETGDLNGIDDGYPRAVWSAPGGGTVWFSSTARLRRFDGEKFVSVDLPSPPGFQVANVGGITGTGENDVWIATAAIRLPISFPGEWRFVLFHYDGQSVSLVHDRPVSGEPSSAPLVHLLGPEKVWVVETTRPPGIQSGFVWDGASASELTLPPFTIDDLWARAPNDVYLLGRMNARGSYLFHYDGQGFTPIFAADRLETQTLTGNATSLWLGGENGATVRAALPAAVY